jgi:hypothetical protein
METVFDFIEYRRLARGSSPAPEGEAIEAREWTIQARTRPVLYQHPAFSGTSRLAYSVWVGREYVLAFDVATGPESWGQPGDGVSFAIYVESEPSAQHATRHARQVFSTYIDPKHDETARRWHSYTVDLSDYAGQTVIFIFETGTGPMGDFRFDWAGWGTPRLLRP